jgi:hypothetical protein
MLAIDSSAVDAITTLVESSGLPDSGGVRLAPAADALPTAGIHIQLADGPGLGDQVVQSGPAHVFVDPEIADELHDRTLEARTTGNRVTFALTGPRAA